MFDLPPYRGKWPEIWVAAHGPRMLQATGRYADAWVPFVLTRSTDYAQVLETVRAAASDAGRDPMSIMPAVVRAVVTGRNRDDVDEVLDSVMMEASALTAPAEVWARHGAQHPLGADFSGVQDLIPQTIDKQTALSYTAKVPASLVKEILTGHPTKSSTKWRNGAITAPDTYSFSTAAWCSRACERVWRQACHT